MLFHRLRGEANKKDKTIIIINCRKTTGTFLKSRLFKYGIIILVILLLCAAVVVAVVISLRNASSKCQLRVISTEDERIFFLNRLTREHSQVSERFSVEISRIL
jgi:hypothetical protein